MNNKEHFKLSRINKGVKGKKGFTLMEIIIVIAIIAILAVVAIPQITGYVEAAKRVKDLQVATDYMKAASMAILMTSEATFASETEWYVFKWGYSTDNKNNMNIHMGTAPLNADGQPGLGDTKRDGNMQLFIAETMGWTNAKGEIDGSSIPRPESASVQYTYAQNNSLVFYVNVNTGEILVDKTISKNWVDVVGIDAEFTK